MATEFNKNPLKGLSISDGIYDANGNKLLDRVGTEWSENDQMGYDMLMRSMDFEYQADLLNYQNQFNSASEQAKRLREAGINPDLQSIQSQPSATSSASAPNTELKEGQELQRNFNFARDILQALPHAIQSYQQIESNNLDLALKDLRISTEADLVARREIGKQLTLDDIKDKFSNPQLNLQGYSKRMQKRIQTEIDNYVWDVNNRDIARSIIYDAKKDAEQKRQGYLDILGRHGFSLDDDTFLGVIREVNKVMHDSAISKSRYDADYYGKASGRTRAESENASYDLKTKKDSNDISATLFKKANDLMDSEKGSDIAKGAILYLSLLFAQSKGFN